MSFEDNIKKWVQLDNQIKIYSDKIKQLRDEKSSLTNNLMTQADDNNYKNAVIQITDGKLKFTTTKVQSPLTFKYIEDTLVGTIKDSNARDIIIKRLKDNRDVKYTSEIKRYPNPTST